MNITKAAVLTGIIIGGLGLTQVGAQTVAFQNSTSLPDNGLQGSGTGGPYNLGLEFTVNTAIQVTALGAYDSTIGRSGTGFASPVEVGILSEATSTFVSPTVTFSGVNGTIIDGSQFQTIATLTLEPGTYKIIGSGYGVDTAEDWNVFFTGDTSSPITFNDSDGALTLGVDYFSYDTDGLADANMTDGTPAPGYAAGTFIYTVVPEPSAKSFLFLGGVMAVAFAFIRRPSYR